MTPVFSRDTSSHFLSNVGESRVTFRDNCDYPLLVLETGPTYQKPEHSLITTNMIITNMIIGRRMSFDMMITEIVN